jgi:hypothetical protein
MAVPQTRFTQTQLIDRVRGDLGLRTSTFLTDAEIALWAIEASDMASRETRWFKTTTTANSTSGTKEYDLPTGCLAVEEVNYSTSGTAGTHLPLKLLTLNDLYSMDPYWRSTSSGTPLWYYLRGVTSYGLHYTPGSSVTGGIQIVYTALAAVPASGSDTYSIPHSGGEFILNYVKWWASMKDASGEGGRRVEAFERIWKEALERLKREVESTSEGEACIVGGDSVGQGRWWGFNPNDAIEAAP